MGKVIRRAIFALSVLAVGAAAVQFLPPPDNPPVLPTRLERAAWIGIEWAMEPHTDAEIRAFAAELSARQIKYAYFYVSYLKLDGIFNPTFAHAADFTRRFRDAAPDIVPLAWIGVPVQGQDAAGNPFNRLDDPATRVQIAQFAAMTVRDLGFSGVHLNAELIADGDRAFLSTLSDIRAQLPDGAMLSATAHALKLAQPTTFVPYPVMAHHWSTDYLREVAAYVDQIALMAYDSGLPFPADYRRWMAYQVREATAALAGSEAALIVGFSTSEEWTPSHQTQGETLAAALWGLRAGLAESESPETLAGIAVYPYWETDDEEWGGDTGGDGIATLSFDLM